MSVTRARPAGAWARDGRVGPRARFRLPEVAVALIALAGIAAGVAISMADVVEPYSFSDELDLVVGWSFIGVGLYAWWRRPANPIGPLMVATGFFWFAAVLGSSGSPAVFAIAGVIGSLFHATTVHLLLAFPSGRLGSRAARVAAVAGYVVFLGGSLLVYLVTDFRSEFACGPCPENPLQVVHDQTVTGIVVTGTNLAGAAVLGYVLVRLIVKWYSAEGWRRRALTPLLFAGAATAFLLDLTVLALAFEVAVLEEVFIAAVAAFATVPYAFLVGLVRGAMLGGDAAGELVVKLREAPDFAHGRDAVREALGDPSLELGYLSEDGTAFIGPDGYPIELPRPGEGHAHELIEIEGEPVAVMVYDAVLVDDPHLVDTAARATALAIETHKLDAELRAKLVELRESRQRIVEAGYVERRRLERDLHDGAQQRLVSLALELKLARSKLEDDPAEAGALLDSAERQLGLALDELRELARGLHPAILSDHGLDAALLSLASRAPFDVEIDAATNGRLPDQIESAAYFVVSEALTNAAKHANATYATVSVSRENGRVTVEITDDGDGGADVSRGTGLSGLADRVTALEGGLEVESDPGDGTTIRATMPCG